MAIFDVVGPICESSDVLAQQRELPAGTSEGDVLLVSEAGAYGMTMANHYNLRALPAEAVLDEGDTDV
jgi:diaminopimelate decarboxylase/aspartate kinase